MKRLTISNILMVAIVLWLSEGAMADDSTQSQVVAIGVSRLSVDTVSLGDSGQWVKTKLGSPHKTSQYRGETCLEYRATTVYLKSNRVVRVYGEKLSTERINLVSGDSDSSIRQALGKPTRTGGNLNGPLQLSYDDYNGTGVLITVLIRAGRADFFGISSSAQPSAHYHHRQSKSPVAIEF